MNQLYHTTWYQYRLIDGIDVLSFHAKFYRQIHCVNYYIENLQLWFFVFECLISSFSSLRLRSFFQL